MKLNKRIPTMLSGALIVPMALVACSEKDTTNSEGKTASGDTEEVITLEFWHHSGNPEEAAFLREILEEYEAENSVKFEFLSLPADSALEKLNTAISSGSTPDLSTISGSMLAPFYAQEALVNLEDMYASSQLNGELDEAVLSSVRDHAGGELMSVPFAVGSSIIWYRTDWFEEAGLDKIETWDDFYHAADVLTDVDENKFGFTIRGGSGGVFPMLQYAYAYSGVDTLFDEDGVSTLTHPDIIEAVERYVAMYDVYTPKADLNNGFNQMVEQFGAGMVGMMQHNLGSYTDNERALGDNFAGMMFPASKTGKNVILSDPVQQFVVYETSEYPEESWKVIEYLMSHDVNSRINEQKSQLPVNLEAQQDAWVAEIEPLVLARELMASDGVTMFAAPLYLPEYSEIHRNEMEPRMQEMLQGQITVETYLQEFADMLTAAQQSYMERQ